MGGFQFKGIEDYPNPGASSGTTADTSFDGGTKQDDNCAGVGTGKPPNKDDLKRVYLASTTLASNGHTYLELAWARIPQNSTSASAHVGFEFNQSSTLCPAGSNGLVQRTLGDLLVVYDFEGGSAAPVLTLRKWVTAANATCEVGSSSPPCWGTAQNLTAGGFAEGKVNTEDVTDALAPPALDSTSGTSTSETLATQEFGEAGIDLTAAGVIPVGTCAPFGKAFAVSRSSGNSAQAQMKDLVGPANFSLNNCGTVIIKKRTNPRGLNQEFAFTSTLSGSQLSCTQTTAGPPAETPTSFSLNDNGNSGTGDSAANTQTCTNVPAGTYTVTEGADPSGFQFNNFSCTSTGTGTSTTPTSSTTQKNVSITIAGGGSVTCVYTNNQQLGAIKITKTSSKSGNGLAGATFSITKGGTAITGSPFTTGSNGTVCVDGLTFGSYVVTETGAPTGYAIDDPAGRTITVDNNASCSDATYVGESTSFTDTPLADIQVRFRDGGSGETALDNTAGPDTGMTCNNATGTSSRTDTTGWDDTLTVSGIKIGSTVVTVTCTIKIDP